MKNPVRRTEILVAAALLLASRKASAQVRYDLGALASFQQRFLIDAPAGRSVAAEGGGLTLDGHVAVFPLLRVGAWATGEVSAPLDSSAPREIFSGGLRLKIVPPWPSCWNSRALPPQRAN